MGEKEKGANGVRLRQVWSSKHRKATDFNVARNGDHLLTPFECETCVFLKLTHRLPLGTSHTDNLLLMNIKRALLDAMWSRESSTVEANRRRVEKQLKFSKSLGLGGPYVQPSPFPSWDHAGYEVAIGILMYSLTPGRHSKSHCQFSTIRSLRAAYSNQVRASSVAAWDNLSLSSSKGIYQKVSRDVAGSYWFSKFIEGLQARMGTIYKPNRGLSQKLLRSFFKEVQLVIEDQNELVDQHDWIVFYTYTVISYVLSLRGNEALLLDLRTLNREWTMMPEDLAIIPLLGRLKGEAGDTLHRLPTVRETNSGIKIYEALQDLLKVKARFNFKDGPAISDIHGHVLTSKALNEKFHEVLIQLYRDDRQLFPIEIKSEMDIKNEYMCYRSFRRSSDTQALNAGVSAVDIEVVNRWSVEEKSKSKKANLPMIHHYAQVDLLVGPFKRYTKAM